MDWRGERVSQSNFRGGKLLGIFFSKFGQLSENRIFFLSVFLPPLPRKSLSNYRCVDWQVTEIEAYNHCYTFLLFEKQNIIFAMLWQNDIISKNSIYYDIVMNSFHISYMLSYFVVSIPIRSSDKCVKNWITNYFTVQLLKNSHQSVCNILTSIGDLIYLVLKHNLEMFLTVNGFIENLNSCLTLHENVLSNKLNIKEINSLYEYFKG